MEINLEQPGHLYASADFAKDYTFFLVVDKPHYTAKAFEGNPNCVAGKDLLFRSAMIADQKGQAFVNLDPKAKDIKKKLEEPVTKALAVVLATSRPGNRNPNKRQAVVKPCTLKKAEDTIKLKGLRITCSKHHWVAYHHAIFFVQMTVKGRIKEVVCELDPKKQPIPILTGIWEPVMPGQFFIKRLILGGVGDRHAPNPKCLLPDKFHPQWGQLWGQQAHRGVVKCPIQNGVENYIIGVYPRYAGTFVLTVKGTGQFDKIKDKITLRFNGNHPHPGD